MAKGYFGQDDLRRNPVYLEHCGNCDHTQAYHIGVTGPHLNGHMVPCRFPSCASKCQTWEPTWAVSKAK